MKAIVIGASGLVGSHCLKHLKDNDWDVIGTHCNYPTASTVTFNFESKTLSVFCKEQNFKPDLIIHCAALTNVDYCERNVEESYVKTVLPTLQVAEFCKDNDITLVYISTDYVFDGLAGPYTERDNVRPLNIYGKHKLECESIVSNLSKYLILRITNVYGEEERAKNFISRLIKDAQNKISKNLFLPFDQYATPIYAGDIARMLLYLVRDEKNGIYHLGGTDYYNRYQLAEKVLSYFKGGHKVTLTPVATAIANQTATRPLMGGLLNKKFIQEYPEFTFRNVDSFILKVFTNEL